MPPTAAVARAPGQLPAETTGFVGLRSELVTLAIYSRVRLTTWVTQHPTR